MDIPLEDAGHRPVPTPIEIARQGLLSPTAHFLLPATHYQVEQLDADRLEVLAGADEASAADAAGFALLRPRRRSTQKCQRHILKLLEAPPDDRHVTPLWDDPER